MNEAIPIRWRWFVTGKGKVGVVQYKMGPEIEYRIGPVDDFLERMDVLQVCAWGAQLTTAEGEALLGGGQC